MGNTNRVSRDQFTEFKTTPAALAGTTVIRKIKQEGVYTLDSDANERDQISDQRTARHLWNLIKRQNSRFGTGWAITGGSNQVTVSAGDVAVMVEINKARICHLTANTNVACPAPTTTRTDCLYLDITLPIIDSVDDPTLVNPALGKESDIDQRLKFVFAVNANASAPPTAPANHYYVAIATIARTASATIPDASITNLLDQFNTIEDNDLVVSYLKADGTRALTGDMAVTDTKTIDGVDLSLVTDVIYSQHLEAGFATTNTITDWGSSTQSAWTQVDITAYVKKLRLSYFKRANAKKLYVGFDGYSSYAANGSLRVTVAGSTPVERTAFPAGTGWFVQTPVVVDISALETNADANVTIELKCNQNGVEVGIRKVVVWTQRD